MWPQIISVYHFNVKFDVQVCRICNLHVPIFVESALVVIGNRSTVYKRTLETPREPELMRGEFSFLNEKIRTWLFLPTQLALSFPLVTLCQGAKPLTKKSSKITFCHIILEAREIDLCKEQKIVILFGQLCGRCYNAMQWSYWRKRTNRIILW